MISIDMKPSKKGDLAFVVEKIRLVGYLGFWVIVLTGVVLTLVFSGIDLEHTLLVQIFGYNNICVYFDFPPANYVLPLLWAITLVFLLWYIVIHWLQMRTEAQKGLLTWQMYRYLSGFKIFEAFTLVAFSTIFAVSPTGHDHTLYIHTAPYFLVQIGMVSLAISNTLHGIKSGYWKRLSLPTWFETTSKIYVVFFTILVCCSIPYGMYAMKWGVPPAALKGIAPFADFTFLFCAAIIPIAKDIYFLWARGDKLEAVYLTTDTL